MKKDPSKRIAHLDEMKSTALYLLMCPLFLTDTGISFEVGYSIA